MSKHAPVFIVGAPRSGTTLLSQILTIHPDVFIFNETLFYDFINSSKELNNESILAHLLQRLDIRTDKTNSVESVFGCMISEEEAKVVKTKLKKSDLGSSTPLDHKAMFTAFMTAINETKNKSIWGEKTPHHIYHLKQIKNDFPKARIIHVVRDPHTFVRSYKYAWRRAKNNLDLFHPIITPLMWRRSVRAVQQYKNTNMVLEIRYEDLVKNMEENAKKVCLYLGIEYYPSMIDIQGNNSSFKESTENHVPNWENHLCDYICKEEIREYNYKQTFSTFPLIPLIRSIITLPQFIVRVYPVISKKWGGITKYIKSRI